LILLDKKSVIAYSHRTSPPSDLLRSFNPPRQFPTGRAAARAITRFVDLLFGQFSESAPTAMPLALRTDAKIRRRKKEKRKQTSPAGRRKWR
jgi:hypothetical protein